MDLPEKVRTAILDVAASHSYIEAVLLHSSRAKGTSRIDSDVDIALLLASDSDRLIEREARAKGIRL